MLIHNQHLLEMLKGLRLNDSCIITNEQFYSEPQTVVMNCLYPPWKAFLSVIFLIYTSVPYPPPPTPPTLSPSLFLPRFLNRHKKKRSMQICVREIFTPAASSYSEDQSGREFHVLSDATARGRAECRNSGSLGTGG